MVLQPSRVYTPRRKLLLFFNKSAKPIPIKKHSENRQISLRLGNFLKEIPATVPVIFNDNLRGVLRRILGDKYFVVKSIYFDKPQTSNWYVSYHQDLTISVDKKLSLSGFDFWTVKQNQFAV